LFPLIIAFTAVGSYTTRNSLFDLAVLIVFGIIGYVCKKIHFPVAPMAFTLILGPLTEKALRQSLSMSGGDLSVLVRGPISTGLIVVAAVVLCMPLLRVLWRRLTGRKAIDLPLADN
jgi:putative tricarboxylic transport membrane protein